MRLKVLLKNIDEYLIEMINYKNINVSSLVIKADDCIKNSLFFAIKGQSFDGNDYIDVAIKNKAKIIITESDYKNDNVIVIKVSQIRKVMALIAKAFYNNACDQLNIVGVIGTNGKTTSSTLMYEIMSRQNKNSVGLIGTNGVYIGKNYLPTSMTTPDPIDLHYYFSLMYAFNIKTVFIEISAHAIYYDKVFGINFESAVLTNISNEHLDFFNSFEEYEKVKLDFFENYKINTIIYNADTPYARYFNNLDNYVLSYGLYTPCDVFAIDIKYDIQKMSFVVNYLDQIVSVDSHLIGDFNVYNILSAICVCFQLGVNLDNIILAINDIKKIAGRLEMFHLSDNRVIVIDYAHTPDGYQKIFDLITSVRKGEIISLFGVVGYSDVIKRQQMVDIVCKYSGNIIFTTDNSYHDDFDSICASVNFNKPMLCIKDRCAAVKLAIENLLPNQTLLLLGKGSENYQRSGNIIKEYNEVQFVKHLLERNYG